MGWHKAGGAIIDDRTGRRVLWGGYASRRGTSMRTTYEEQDRALRLAAAAPALEASVAELAIALRDLLAGYATRDLSDAPGRLLRRAYTALQPLLCEADAASLAETLRGYMAIDDA